MLQRAPFNCLARAPGGRRKGEPVGVGGVCARGRVGVPWIFEVGLSEDFLAGFVGVEQNPIASCDAGLREHFKFNKAVQAYGLLF